jgi:hypothetical protein
LDHCGSRKAYSRSRAKGAIFVSQLFYWSGKQQAEGGWIYKTQMDLEKETGLSRHSQNKCVEELKRKKVLDTRYERLDHRLYYKINKDALDAIMEADLPSEIRKADLGKSEKRISGSAISGDGQLRKPEIVNSQRIPSEITTEKTTTRATPDLFTNGHQPVDPVVVAFSSVAKEEDSPREISDKLTEEFGLSIPQGREVETLLGSKGAGYVIEKAEIVRKKKGVKNTAGAFMTALRENWKPPKSSIDQKPIKKSRPVEAETESRQPIGLRFWPDVLSSRQP